MPDRTLAIVNPASAAGRTGRQWPAMREALGAAGLIIECHQTAAPGDASTVAAEAAAAGVDLVIAVGGDGTVNEVVNGLLTGADRAPAGVTLGLLPSGTGGDLRRTLGVPTSMNAAVALLARGDRRRIDAARIRFDDGTSRDYVNIADCGVGGEVVRYAESAPRRLGGRAVFAYASVRGLATFGRRSARVCVDGTTWSGEASNIVIANGRWFGGGMCIAPEADPADGMLDVLVITAGRLRTLKRLPMVYRGTHVGRDGGVVVMRGRHVLVDPAPGARLRFDVDGEAIGAAPAAIEVLPAALEVCSPRP